MKLDPWWNSSSRNEGWCSRPKRSDQNAPSPFTRGMLSCILQQPWGFQTFLYETGFPYHRKLLSALNNSVAMLGIVGQRWNGAECNRLESAKSGPKTSRCVVGSGFRRLIGGRGLAGELLPHFDIFSGLLCKSLIINAVYLHKSFRMDSQCPASCAKITARLADWAKRKGETHGDIAIQAVCEGAFFKRGWPGVVGSVF